MAKQLYNCKRMFTVREATQIILDSDCESLLTGEERCSDIESESNDISYEDGGTLV